MEKSLLDVGVLGAIVLSVALFINNKLWPWYTTVYWPKMSEREDKRNTLMENINVSIIRMLEGGEVRNTAIERLLTIAYDNNSRLIEYGVKLEDIEEEAMITRSAIAQAMGQEVVVAVIRREGQKVNVYVKDETTRVETPLNPK